MRAQATNVSGPEERSRRKNSKQGGEFQTGIRIPNWFSRKLEIARRGEGNPIAVNSGGSACSAGPVAAIVHLGKAGRVPQRDAISSFSLNQFGMRIPVWNSALSLQLFRLPSSSHRFGFAACARIALSSTLN